MKSVFFPYFQRSDGVWRSGIPSYTLIGAKKEAVRRSSSVWKIVNSSGETVLASDKKDVS